MHKITRATTEDNVSFECGLTNRFSPQLKALLVCLVFIIILSVGNAHGQRPESATPPMGWNTWHAFGCHVTEADVKSAVDAMASNGMKAAEYE